MESLRVDFELTRRAFDVVVALEVGRETMAVVGPSGAGKTSLLRAIAGLDHPSRGWIGLGDEAWFDSERKLDLPPERRRVGMVFQDFALFPHLSVRANVGFGGSPDEFVDRLRLRELQNERPGALSGGEKQRVAVARALAARPAVLLLDEPMASLDPALRNDVRAELRRVLADVELPTVLVTHDFEDAAALAATVAVMSEGEIRQVGTPSELVAAPSDGFVANLTGANVLRGRARIVGDLSRVDIGDGRAVFSTDLVDGEADLIVYPWDVAVALEASAGSTLNHIDATIESIVVFGNRARVRLGPIVAEVTAASVERLKLAPGVRAVASFKATGTRLIARAPARR